MDDNIRTYSNPMIYKNSIDWDDDPTGSDGGYDAHGNYIIPSAMTELVLLRKQLHKINKRLEPINYGNRK